MRVLLDENLPESLVSALRHLGHHVESVNSLRLKGLDNSTLYQQVAQDYDLCLTKDAGFVLNVRRMRGPSNTKLIRVVLPQKPAMLFVDDFLKAFEKTDWSGYETGSDWP